MFSFCNRTDVRLRRRGVSFALESWPALIAGVCLGAGAVPALAADDPARADLPVVAPVYRSPFAAYRGWQDVPPRSWVASNEAVGRAGGWRAYAREAARESAREAAVPSSSPSAAAPVVTPPARGSNHVHH